MKESTLGKIRAYLNEFEIYISPDLKPGKIKLGAFEYREGDDVPDVITDAIETIIEKEEK
jgi:hypothetical protein